jgi:hypothetical protein
MKMNVKELEFKAMSSGYVSLYFVLEGEEKRSSSYFLSPREVMFAQTCCLGRNFSPYLDDINHLIQFKPSGIHVIELDGSNFYHRWAEVPGREIENLLRFTLGKALELKRLAEKKDATYEQRNASWEYKVPEYILEGWKRVYKPRIRFRFYGDAKDGFLAAMRDDRVLVSSRSSLKDQFHSLARIARNSSDGEIMTINISPEHNGDAPMSFAWSIRCDKGRVMNGGIIAHPIRAKEPENVEYYKREIVGYEYSTHT